MGYIFQQSPASAFYRSQGGARNRAGFSFICVSVYWPFAGSATFGAPDGSNNPTFNNSWPIIYTNKVETWVIYSGPSAGTYNQTTVWNDYYDFTNSNALISNSTTITGAPPAGTFDFKSISAASTATTFNSAGTDGTYSVLLTSLKDYPTAVTNGLNLLATIPFPAFPIGLSQVTTSPFISGQNMTLGYAPSVSGNLQVNNPCWVGAAANGFPLGPLLTTLADYQYPLNTYSPSNQLPLGILFGKSQWRITSTPPTWGAWVDPNLGSSRNIWGPNGLLAPPVNTDHSKYYSHVLTPNGGGTAPDSPLSDQAPVLVASTNLNVTNTFNAADAPQFGELGFRSTVVTSAF